MKVARELIGCERGAIYVFGLFGTFFLAGLVYATLGLGRALVESSYASDRTDAAALVGSLVLARGMNLLVYINLLMAGLLAVLIGLRLAQTLLTIGAITLYGLAWPTYGATLPLAGLATNYAKNVGDLYENAKDVLYPILEGLHEVEEAISIIVPPLAIAEVAREGVSGEGKDVATIALPSSIALPIAWDTFPRLCGKGARLGAELALLPVSALGGGATGFLEPVLSAAGAMGGALSNYLCGDGEGPPPEYEENIERTYPRSALARNCEETADESACANAKNELEMARYDEESGDCAPSSDCRRGGVFEKMATLARRQCAPDSSLKPKKWLYQERLVEITLEGTPSGRGLGWKLSKERSRSSTFVASPRPPCGPSGERGKRYESRLYEDSGSRPLAVCLEGDSENLPFGFLEPPRSRGEERKVVRRVVSHVLGCVVDEKKKTPLAEEGESLDGDDDKSPSKLEDELELGAEAFQLRVLGAMEATPLASTEKALGILDKSRSAAKDPFLDAWKRLPSLYSAQSEYYFDHPGDVPREEWLWQPRWTARLVRIRLPSHDESERENERRTGRRSSDEGLQKRFSLEVLPNDWHPETDFEVLETLIVH